MKQTNTEPINLEKYENFLKDSINVLQGKETFKEINDLSKVILIKIYFSKFSFTL